MQQVLKNVTWDVKTGERVGLVGEPQPMLPPYCLHTGDEISSGCRYLASCPAIITNKLVIPCRCLLEVKKLSGAVPGSMMKPELLKLPLFLTKPKAWVMRGSDTFVAPHSGQ